MNFSDITFVTGMIALAGAIFIYWRTKRDNEEQRLNNTMMNLLNIGITYPYLEDTAFINNIKSYNENEKAIRYELYCIMWFNFLEEVFIHFNSLKAPTEDYVDVEEIVLTHRTWWEKNKEDNDSGYKTMDFQSFINSYLSNG